MLSFQEIIFTLNKFWASNGCLVLQPYSSELGAGTLHPATIFGGISDKDCNIAYVQPTIRPSDGRVGMSINRLYQHHQYQVLLKPYPNDIQDLYIQSLNAIGINTMDNDIRFVEDNWTNPSVGAWGLGWEIWCNGMEITQFTYMQQIGGIDCKIIPGELAYGLERIAMCVQNVNSISEIVYSDNGAKYCDVFFESERQFTEVAMSGYKYQDLQALFNIYYENCNDFIKRSQYLVGYDFCLKLSHVLNLMDASGFLSVSERADYILQIRKLVKECCHLSILTVF